MKTRKLRLFNQQWGRPRNLSFMASLVGVTLGTGDILRFPPLLLKEGISFIVAYTITMSIIGVPLVTLELALAQFTSAGPIDCWSFSPIFRGVGVGGVITAAILACTYTADNAYVLLFTLKSLQKRIPWTTCNREWASDRCTDFINVTSASHCRNNGWSVSNDGACYNSNNLTKRIVALWNVSLASRNNIKLVLPAQDYLEREVLGITKPGVSLYNLGNIHWDLVLCLLVMWSTVCLSLFWGLRSIVLVLYFSICCVCVIFSVLFVFVQAQAGAAEGIKHFFRPHLEYLGLLHFSLWINAAVQVFYTLGISMGILICVGSHSRYKADVCMYAFVTTLINFLTGIISGILMFAILGSAAKQLNIDIANFVTGSNIGFIVYAHALPSLPGGAVWSALFFFMLYLLVMMTAILVVETVVSSMCDMSRFLNRHRRKLLVCLSALYFLFSLPMVTDGGHHIIDLIDSGIFSFIFLLTLLECVAVAWVYGVINFVKDISFMVGLEVFGCLKWKRVKFFFALSWGIVCPAFALYATSTTLYGEITKQSSDVERAIEMTLSLITLVPVPVLAARTMYTIGGTCSKRLRAASKPSNEWGPLDPKDRSFWLSAHKKVQGGYDRSKYLDYHEEILLGIYSGNTSPKVKDRAKQSFQLEFDGDFVVQGFFDSLSQSGFYPPKQSDSLSSSVDVSQTDSPKVFLKTTYDSSVDPF